MQLLIDFLSSPTWQGIQGLIALIAFVITLPSSRKWIQKQASIKWILGIPWLWIFMIGAITIGIGVGFKFQNMYQGLVVAFAGIIFGLGLQLIQTSRFASKANRLLEKITKQHNASLKGLRRIADFQQSSFALKDWKLVYSIDEKGDDLLLEEFTIVPSAEYPIYLQFKRYSLSQEAIQEFQIHFAAKNLTDNIPLTTFEVERSDKYSVNLILLDPPSTVTHPKRINVICKRVGIWNTLIEQDEDNGSLFNINPCNSIQLEFIAPPGRKWASLQPAYNVGEVKIESTGNISRIVWNIPEAHPLKYSYRVFLEKAKE